MSHWTSCRPIKSCPSTLGKLPPETASLNLSLFFNASSCAATTNEARPLDLNSSETVSVSGRASVAAVERGLHAARRGGAGEAGGPRAGEESHSQLVSVGERVDNGGRGRLRGCWVGHLAIVFEVWSCVGVLRLAGQGLEPETDSPLGPCCPAEADHLPRPSPGGRGHSRHSPPQDSAPPLAGSRTTPAAASLAGSRADGRYQGKQ